MEARVFREQPIHGIRVSSGTLLVWGSRSVALCPLSAIQDALDVPDAEVCFARGRARDWVYDAVLDADGSGVLVTAHNEIVEISWAEGMLRFGKVISPSRPILYAANVRCLADGRLLVAGGTVFGEILVWTCRVGSGGECRVLHVLTGHEGSIFGVSISDEVVVNGKTLRLLASCSDDRTIRVWDISDTAVEGGKTLAEEYLHRARETGFGSSAPAGPGEGGSADEPIAVAMGHVSRIWHVKFPPLPAERASSVIPLYSFGEDSTAQLWELDLAGFQGQGPVVLAHRDTFSNHEGKHIWSSSICAVSNGASSVVTGGSDGKISLIEERAGVPDDIGTVMGEGVLSLTEISHKTLSLLESPPTEGKKARNRDDVLLRYAFINDDTLLATTRSGKLLAASFGQGITWSEVSVDAEYNEDLRMCSVVASPSTDIAILGTTTKALYLYAEGQLSRMGDAPGKILNVIPLTGDGISTKFLVTMHSSPEVRILTANLTSKEIISDVSLQGVDERFVLTSAAQFHGYLIIGSRNGFMEVFTIQNDNYTRITQINPRSDDTVTSILALPGQTSDSISFLTTNRDGKYRIYELDTRDTTQPPIVHLRHETSPPFGPQVEDAWFFKENDKAPASLILSGFRSKNFVVWNETTREYMATVDCGGGHRTFAHTRSTTRAGHLRLAFTKAAVVYIHSQTHAPGRTLSPGVHGREVRAIAGTEALGDASYFATGSEDTSIRIWKCLSETRGDSFRCVASMKLHTTGLQSLKWCGNYLLSSGGNEDLYAWRVSTLPAGFSGLGVFCEGALRDKSPEGDLRITDFDVCEVDGGLTVTAAFSNSVFKMYRYERPAEGNKEGEFRGLATGEYTGACLTQVRHLEQKGSVSYLLTASTDGHIALWRPLDGGFILISTARIHQSSIKSLDLREDETSYLVITTGDDNALGVTSITPKEDGTFAASARTIVRSAHAAAINGVVDLPGGRVATVSNDQRVKIWRVGGTSGSPVELLEDLYSGVADAGAVEYFPRRGELLVGGVGMEVWRI